MARYDALFLAHFEKAENGDVDTTRESRHILMNIAQINGLIAREPLISVVDQTLNVVLGGEDPLDILMARINAIAERTRESVPPESYQT